MNSDEQLEQIRKALALMGSPSPRMDEQYAAACRLVRNIETTRFLLDSLTRAREEEREAIKIRLERFYGDSLVMSVNRGHLFRIIDNKEV